MVPSVAIMAQRGKMVVVKEQEEFLEWLYHKWSLTICDRYFDTLKSSKMQS